MKTAGIFSVAYAILAIWLAASPQAVRATQTTSTPNAQPEDESRQRSIFQDVQEVNVVNVDVVVTDRDGLPVTGLTSDDFEIYENGERVDFGNFYAVEGGETAALEGSVTGRGVPGRPAGGLVSPEASGDASETAEATARRPLHLIVYVDNVQLRKPDRDRALAHLREVLQKHSLRDDARIMLVSNDRGVTFRNGFTRDYQAIFEALEELETEPTYSFLNEQEMRTLLGQLNDLNADAGNVGITDVKSGGFGTGAFGPDVDGVGGGDLNANGPGSNANRDNTRDMQAAVAGQAQHLVPQMMAYAQKRQGQLQGTIGVLRSFIDHVSGLPGRKAVLYVSGGLSLNPAEALFEAYERRVSGMTEIGRPTLRVGREIERFDMSRELEDLVRHANAGGVTFYAVDASPPSVLSRGSASTAGGGTGAISARFSSQVDTIEERNQHESMELVAEGTGGKVALSSADLDRALESFFVDFENFYSLGYVAEETPADRTRRIEVKLAEETRKRLGKGVDLRYRNQVRDKTVAEKMAEQTLSALMMDVHENPLEIQVEAKEQTALDDGKYAVPVLVKVPLGKLVLLPGESLHEAKVNIYVAVLDEKGRTSPVARQACPIRVPNQELLVALGQDAGCGVRLLMRKGHQRVAVGVRDELAAVSSTVFLDVEVPGEPETASLDPVGEAESR